MNRVAAVLVVVGAWKTWLHSRGLVDAHLEWPWAFKCMVKPAMHSFQIKWRNSGGRNKSAQCSCNAGVLASFTLRRRPKCLALRLDLGVPRGGEVARLKPSRIWYSRPCFRPSLISPLSFQAAHGRVTGKAATQRVTARKYPIARPGSNIQGCISGPNWYVCAPATEERIRKPIIIVWNCLWMEHLFRSIMRTYRDQRRRLAQCIYEAQLALCKAVLVMTAS